MKMSLGLILTTFAYFPSIQCARNHLVVNKFNGIQEYALKMVQNPDYNLQDMKFEKTSTTHYNFCRSLLAAPMFEIQSEVENTPFNRTDRGLHNIESDAWAQLKNICKVRSNRGSKKVFIAQKEYSLPGHHCINHDSRLTWLVSYATDASVGLLFTTVPVNSVYALIDRVATIKLNTAESVIDKFLRSIRKIEPSKSESLCSLKKISQLRLCAICADSLHRRNHDRYSPYCQINEENHYQELYVDPHFNYYRDEKYGKPDNCPIINVITTNIPGYATIEVPALRCNVSMKGIQYELYVKKNMNEHSRTGSVYIIENGTVLGETTVHQMKNILAIDALL